MKTFANERRIVHNVMTALLANGYTLEWDDEGEYVPIASIEQGIADVSYTFYECAGRNRWMFGALRLVATKGSARSFVWFIFSNGNDGRDVIADYGMSLSKYIDPILNDAEEKAVWEDRGRGKWRVRVGGETWGYAVWEDCGLRVESYWQDDEGRAWGDCLGWRATRGECEELLRAWREEEGLDDDEEEEGHRLGCVCRDCNNAPSEDFE